MSTQHYVLTQDDRDKLELLYDAFIGDRSSIKGRKLLPFNFVAKPKPGTTIPGCKILDDDGKIVPGKGQVVMWQQGHDNSDEEDRKGKLVKHTVGTSLADNDNQELESEDTDLVRDVYNYSPYEVFPFQFINVTLTQGKTWVVAPSNLPMFIAKTTVSIGPKFAQPCKLGWLTHDHSNGEVEWMQNDEGNDITRLVRNPSDGEVAADALCLVQQEPGGQLIVVTEYC